MWLICSLDFENHRGKGLLVLHTLIHFNNLDGLTSQFLASEEEDKEGKAKY